MRYCGKADFANRTQSELSVYWAERVVCISKIDGMDDLVRAKPQRLEGASCGHILSEGF